ncbi:MAG: hypothetical protein GY832_35435, partial [Chloroflexi bacterium]|nr:hypothetical protein [Chloroflexota bacterium]
MDHTDLREKLITYLHKRGWHQKLAKKRQGEETLLEHALKCFDTTHTLAQLLPDIFSSPQETSLASAAHDVGKENDSAQRALRQGKALGDHVAPHLTHSILADMSHYLELGSNVCLPDAALGVNLHHDKGNRTRVRESLIETTSAAPE